MIKVLGDSEERESPEQVPRRVPPGWEWLLVIAGVLGAVGSLLPWETVNTGLSGFTRNGFQLGSDLSFSWDGLVVLGLSVVAGLIGLSSLTGRPFPRWLNSSPIILGICLLAETISDENSLSTQIHNLERRGLPGFATIGYGLWLAVVAGAIVLLAGLLGWYLSQGTHRADMVEGDGEEGGNGEEADPDAFWGAVEAHQRGHDAER